MTPSTSAANAFARRSRISLTRLLMGPRSNRAPALEGADEGDFVRVFEIATDGDASRDSRDRTDDALEPFGEVHRCRLPLKRGVRGDDHLLERVAVALRLVGTRKQLADAEPVGPD